MKNIWYLICLNQEIMSKCIIHFIESVQNIGTDKQINWTALQILFVMLYKIMLEVAY